MPKFSPIDPETFLPVPKVVDALSDVIAGRVQAGAGAATAEDIAAAVAAHVNDETPHPVYDESPSYSLFYQARKAAQP